MKRDDDPGVPEALPRILLLLRERAGEGQVDRIWIFPPRIRGRKEWGLVVATCFTDEEDRRRVMTARYSAFLSGRGLDFESEIAEEALAPHDRLPRIVDGVVRRTEEDLGEPRMVEVGGEGDVFDQLLDQFQPSPLEAERP